MSGKMKFGGSRPEEDGNIKLFIYSKDSMEAAGNLIKLVHLISLIQLH